MPPFAGIDIVRPRSRSFQGVDCANPSYMAEIRGYLGGPVAHYYPPVGLTDDGTTTTWRDWIGGHAVVSFSQATRLVKSSSLAGLNGRPGITGSNASVTRLVSTDGALAARLNGSAAYTVYIVRRSNAVYSTVQCCVGATVGTSYIYFGNLGSGVSAHARHDGTAPTAQTGVTQNLTGACVESHVFTGSAASVYSNGGLTASSANTRVASLDRFCIGAFYQAGVASLAFDGDIGDIIIYLGAHTDAQRMYIERLIAKEYGWPVLQGVRGFSAANYMQTVVDGGLAGSAAGFGQMTLVRIDAQSPSASRYLAGRGISATDGGFFQRTTSTNSAASFIAYSGALVASASPSIGIAAGQVGKLTALVGTHDGPGGLVRSIEDRVEIGAGTPISGYFPMPSGYRSRIGERSSGSDPASECSIFGVAQWDGPPSVAQIQASMYDSLKTTGRLPRAISGGVMSNLWQGDGSTSLWRDEVGGENMSAVGTLTATQIIIPTWPW